MGSDPRDDRDGFDADERRALDAWEAPPLPDGFVAAAVDRALTTAPSARPRRRSLIVGGTLLGLAAAAALTTVVALPGRAPGPREITIGGTVLSCDDCRLGVAPIGGEGEAMRAGAAGLVGAAAGAALTAAVLVSVYDGRVSAVSPAGERVEAGPGEQIVVREGRSPELVTPARGPQGGASKTPEVGGGEPAPTDAGGGGVRPEAEPAAVALVGCREDAAAASARAERLEGQVQELERKVKALSKQADVTRTYDLSQEQLLEMAQHCELRWDLPSITLDEPMTITRSAVDELGLDGEQVRAVNAVLAKTNQRLLDAVMGLYVEATGDPAPAGFAPDAMFAEILDKTPRETIKAVFQRLSAERAGLAPPPADPAAGEPIERLLRLVTAAGDQLERELADKVGADVARALRDEHQGWGEKSRSRVGCPGEE